MPMREVRQKYTLSDMILMAWDSKQKSYNMSQKFKKQRKDSRKQPTDDPRGDLRSYVNDIVETDTHYLMPSDLNNGVAIPKKWFDDNGQLDLRRAKGDEAAAYFRAVGIDMPPVIRM